MTVGQWDSGTVERVAVDPLPQVQDDAELRYQLSLVVVGRIKYILAYWPMTDIEGNVLPDVHSVVEAINRGRLSDGSLADLQTKGGNIRPARVYA